jgi:hypothetical protein
LHITEDVNSKLSCNIYFGKSKFDISISVKKVKNVNFFKIANITASCQSDKKRLKHIDLYDCFSDFFAFLLPRNYMTLRVYSIQFDVKLKLNLLTLILFK